MTTESTGGEVSSEAIGSTQEASEANHEGQISESEGSEESESAPELYTITVDGEEMQVTMDELLKSVQTAKASGKRFQEAASMRKEAEAARQELAALEEQLLRNPLEAMKKKGVPEQSIKKHYEDVLYQMYQYDQLSDEEKASRQEKLAQEQKMKEYEEKLKELELMKQEKEQLRFQEEVAREEEVLTSQFLDALESQSVPNTPEAIQWMANYMVASIEAGNEVDLSTAAAIYKQSTSKSLRSQIESLNEDQLLELIGEKKLNKLRSKEIQKVKSGNSRPSAPSVPLVDQIVRNSGGDATNMSDFFDSLKRREYKY